MNYSESKLLVALRDYQIKLRFHIAGEPGEVTGVIVGASDATVIVKISQIITTYKIIASDKITSMDLVDSADFSRIVKAL